MVITNVFSDIVEVRRGRRLFVRKVLIGVGEDKDPAVQIVAVHGTCASQQQYQTLLEALEATEQPGVSVVLYDCLGLSKSPIDTRDAVAYKNEEHWRDLQAITERFASPDLPIFFMGHSYGPTHIFNYLSSTKDKKVASGLILVATAMRKDHLQHPDGGHPIMKLPLFLLTCIQSYLTDAFNKMAVHPDNLAALQANLRDDSNSNDMAVARAYHTNMRWLTPDKIAPTMNSLSSLIIHGANDKIIPLECGQELHNLVLEEESSKFVVVEHAGHLVQIEQPEEVAQAIASFLFDRLSK